ncbi:MAG: hypothetical protein AB1634_12155 [Thermodesulfobacteriota bacterium]
MTRARPLIDTQEFLSLSSFLNYQLSGEPVNWRGILDLLVGDKEAPVADDLLLDGLAYLGEAYGGQKRRLGPLAILHPIRAASLLAMAQDEPSSLDLLTTLLHDKDEDIREELYEPDTWDHLEERYRRIVIQIDANANWFLHERLHFLTKPRGQCYNTYLGHLIENARGIPALLAIKLADRLDNTLDLRVDLRDFTDSIHCFQVLFDILFVNAYRGLKLRQPHPMARKINGAMRLYQLYKNALFLSLLRAAGPTLEPAADRLFLSLAVASIREAQTNLLHLFAYHIKEPGQQRALLMDVLAYAHADGFHQVRRRGSHRLDGLFLNHFVFDSREQKREGLAALYRDKSLMASAAVAFIAVFASFINDPTFFIRGISPAGITAQD